MRYGIALLATIVATVATAETLGVVTGADGASIRLTDERRMCVGNARYGEWVSADGRSSVPGCWVTDGRVAYVSFFDGERGDVPLALLKKPTSL